VVVRAGAKGSEAGGGGPCFRAHGLARGNPSPVLRFRRCSVTAMRHGVLRPAVALLFIFAQQEPFTTAPAAAKLTSMPAPKGTAERKLSSKPKSLVQDDNYVGQFFSWFHAHGGKAEPVTISRRGSVAGLGVHATRAIAAGELVASIPLSTVINIEHVLTDVTLGPLLDEDGGRAELVHSWLSDTDALAVLLVREKRKGLVDSEWGPWLRLLPEEANIVLALDDGFIAELQDSPLAATFRDAKRRLTETHGALLQLKGFRGRPPTGAFKRYLREDHLWVRTQLGNPALACVVMLEDNLVARHWPNRKGTCLLDWPGPVRRDEPES
jgi:hypothetical protein